MKTLDTLTEKDFMQNVLDLARLTGWRCYHTHDLDQALRRKHADAVAAGRGVDAVRSLSRRQALGILTDVGGLGGLQVLVASKNLEPTFG